jgi:hypothetical protein
VFENLIAEFIALRFWVSKRAMHIAEDTRLHPAKAFAIRARVGNRNRDLDDLGSEPFAVDLADWEIRLPAP